MVNVQIYQPWKVFCRNDFFEGEFFILFCIQIWRSFFGGGAKLDFPPRNMPWFIKDRWRHQSSLSIFIQLSWSIKQLFTFEEGCKIPFLHSLWTIAYWFPRNNVFSQELFENSFVLAKGGLVIKGIFVTFSTLYHSVLYKI